MTSSNDRLIDPKVWEDLQGKIDDDTKTRDEIRDIVQELEKLGIESTSYSTTITKRKF